MLDGSRHPELLLAALALDPLSWRRCCHTDDISLTPHCSTILSSTRRLMKMCFIVMRSPVGANPIKLSRSCVPLPIAQVTTLSPSAIYSSMLMCRSEDEALGLATDRLRPSLPAYFPGAQCDLRSLEPAVRRLYPGSLGCRLRLRSGARGLCYALRPTQELLPLLLVNWLFPTGLATVSMMQCDKLRRIDWRLIHSARGR